MDIAKYSKLLKLLTIIPILAGVLIFVEGFLPYESMESTVTSKNSRFRSKTASTTYTVNFEGINDQFTQEIYDRLNRGDKVLLSFTKLNRQIRELTTLNDNKLYINDTSEDLALYGFGLVFLLTGLVWLKSGHLKNKHAIILAIIILLGLINLIRMI